MSQLFFFISDRRGETTWRELKKLGRLKFDKRDKSSEKRKSLMTEQSSDDRTDRRPSIHQLKLTINLLQIILLKLIGVEFANIQP